MRIKFVALKKDMADDPYDLAVGKDPYNLTQGDPYDLSGGKDPYDLSTGHDPYNLSGDQSVSQPSNGSSTGQSSSTGESGPSSKDKSSSDGLPTFDEKKTYLLKGRTLNRIISVIRRNRPRAVSGGGWKIAQETSVGTFGAIDADELTLNVCIKGVSTPKTFYVKRSASG